MTIFVGPLTLRSSGKQFTGQPHDEKPASESLLAWSILPLVLSLAAAASPLSDQSAAMQGIATNAETGAPIERASVALERDTQVLRSATTDGSGFYTIGAINPGTWCASATSDTRPTKRRSHG
jgi:hypothetical protein